MYKTGKPLYRLLTDEAEATFRFVQEGYGDALRAIVGALDSQFEILEHTVWTLGQPQFSGRDRTEPALLSALHKNTFLFYAAVELTQRGLFGPANTLLRPIFESLVIAKYCTLADQATVFERWLSGEHIHLTNDILNRIRHPATDELRSFWKSLNHLSHATIYSQQFSHSYSEIKSEIGATLSLVQLLLYLNLHLVRRYFLTPATVRFTRLYGDAKAFGECRERARILSEIARKSFTKPGKQVVREYCAAWEIKPA